MLKKLSVLFVLGLSACGWQLKNSELLPEALRSLRYESADQYSEMSRVLRNQLLFRSTKLGLMAFKALGEVLSNTYQAVLRE